MPPEPFTLPIASYIIYDIPVAPPVATTTNPADIPYKIPYKECYCASYIRNNFKPDLPRGNAWDFKIGGNISVGSIALFNYNGLAHVAYIKGIYENGFVIAERISIKGECIDRERLIEWGKDKTFRGVAVL